MLGILSGKKAEYNRLILSGLLTGPKTPQSIAEYIFMNRDRGIRPLKPNLNKIRNIVSNITRSRKAGGRIPELIEKEYIKKLVDGSLDHTIKGALIALTFQSDLSEAATYHKMSEEYIHTQFDPMMEMMNSIFRNTPLSSSLVNKKEFKKIMNKESSLEFLYMCREATVELINEGLEVDSMSEEAFSNYVMAKWMGRIFKVSLLNPLIRKSR